MTEVSASASASVLGYTHNAIKKLNESRAMLDRYVQHQTSRIDAIHEQNQSTLNQQNDRIQSSLSKLKSIQRQRGVSASGVSHGEGLSSPSTDKENTNDVNGIIQQQKSLAERQMEVERQLANLHLEQKEVQKSLKATSKEEKVAFTKAEQVRKSKERVEKAKQVTVEKLTIAICKYRSLGLDFVKGENDALLVNFTNIDEQEVDRVFSFSLVITENDKYMVEDCTPALKEEVVMRLEEQLNRTEDYPSFMRGIRKAFQKYVLDERL